MADWSNRAAASFSVAVTVLETIPDSLENSRQKLDDLASDLERTKTAAAELAGILTAGTAQAANVLATELGHTSQAAGHLCATFTGLQPVGKVTSIAIENLGNQVTNGANKFGDIGDSFNRTSVELGKVERALKKLLDLHSVDSDTPMNRLITALELSAENTIKAADRLGGHVEQTGKHLESAAVANLNDASRGDLLIKHLSELRAEMGQTNKQIHKLIGKIEADDDAPDNKSGFLGWFRGGGGTR